MFRYQVDDDITLELQSPEQDKILFPLVLANREFIGAYLSWANRINTIADMRDTMQRDLQGMADGRRWAWLIYYQGQAAGRIGIFVSVPDLRECEIYYWLAEDFTGKGIITRAARTIIDYAFGELEMNHVLIGFSDSNQKSGAVAKRLGFQYEVTLRKDELVGEERHDLHFWGVMADEWEIQSKPIFSYPTDEKINLRLHQLHDVHIHYELTWANIADLKRWFPWAAEHSEDNDYNHTEAMLRNYADGRGIMLGIWDENKLVGSASLRIIPSKSTAGVGYWLDKKARGKGIVTRTVKELMRYTFDVRGLERFVLRAATENQESRAVAEQINLQQEAIFRESEFVNGRYLDLVQYSMLKHEWVRHSREK